MAVRGYARSAIVCAVAALTFVPCGSKSRADVRSSTDYRSYHLPGNTPAGLIEHMRRSPLLGLRGAAIAHITPEYKLDVSTTPAGGLCRIGKVNLKLNFVITLPRADEAAMAPATRSLWRSFVAFAKRHEETHRSIYLDCARRFLARAAAFSPSADCGAARAILADMLDDENGACARLQQAFDLREAPRMMATPLFKAANLGGTAPVAATGPDTGGGYALPAQ
jgi:predicted secreted Zn-dependent protease